MGIIREEFVPLFKSFTSARVPAFFQTIPWVKGTRNFDFGGGKNSLRTEYLRAVGVINLTYDPFYLNEELNYTSWETARKVSVESITMANILNRVPTYRLRKNFLQQARDLLDAGGVLLISINEGDKTGIGSRNATGWQQNWRKRMYIPEVQEVFHSVQLLSGIITAAVPRATHETTYWFFS